MKNEKIITNIFQLK